MSETAYYQELHARAAALFALSNIGSELAWRRLHLEESAWAEFATRRHLPEQEPGSVDLLHGIQPIVFELSTIFASGTPILVLTSDGVDPIIGNEKDGYVQRVIAVDRALADQTRIYLKVDEPHRDNPAIVQLTPDMWRLEIADKDRLGEAILGAIAEEGAGIYSHSLYGIAAQSVREALFHRTGKFLLDLHGAVPEEHEMNDDLSMAQALDNLEAEIAGEVDHLICVSSQMAGYFKAKHHALRTPPIICPIFTDAEIAGLRHRIYNARPCAVYAGGVQKWQQIGKMIDLIADAQGHSDFIILTPRPKVIARELMRRSLRPNSNGVLTRSATRAEVFEVYKRCDFGLLLREDSVVNRVACPTKLVEYLTFGVIPVLESSQVGDFVDLGMAFIHSESFRRGEVPSVAERRRMADANYAVIALLRQQSKDGLNQISRAVGSPQLGGESPLLHTASNQHFTPHNSSNPTE